MTAYIVQRLLLAVLVIFGVSIITFFLTFLSGDPAILMMSPYRHGGKRSCTICKIKMPLTTQIVPTQVKQELGFPLNKCILRK